MQNDAYGLTRNKKSSMNNTFFFPKIQLYGGEPYVQVSMPFHNMKYTLMTFEGTRNAPIL